MRFFDISDIGQVDLRKLFGMLPVHRSWTPFSIQSQYMGAVLRSYDTLISYEINSARRLAHFLGQGLVETGFLSCAAEQTGYKFPRLKQLWSKKFANEDEMRAYAGNPEKIANRIYASRLGNGDEQSGDGWRYRGRGFFQITGRNNYERYGQLAGVDLLAHPELLEKDLALSIKVAAAYFCKTGLLTFADENNIPAVSRGVNRGQPLSKTPAIGEADRIMWTTKVLDLVQKPASVLTASPVAAAPTPENSNAPLKAGATGARVKSLQRALHALGYDLGPDDGVYGPSTSRAVLAFQHEHGLPVTGEVDSATETALDAAAKGATPPSVEYDKPRPRPPQTPPKSAPVSRSGTLWSALVAGVMAVLLFLRDQLTSLPNIATPIGEISLSVVLFAVLILALLIIIALRFRPSDRR